LGWLWLIVYQFSPIITAPLLCARYYGEGKDEKGPLLLSGPNVREQGCTLPTTRDCNAGCERSSSQCQRGRGDGDPIQLSY